MFGMITVFHIKNNHVIELPVKINPTDNFSLTLVIKLKIIS